MRGRKALLIGLVGLFTACGGGNSGGDPEPEPQPQAQPPSAATLIFPENNLPCTEGTIISDTRSRITFQWNASQNTDSYQLVVRDLNTLVESTATSNTNEATITVSRGTPYAWFVISRATGVTQTAQSPTWRFYNEGPGIQSYAPFPAQALAPPRGAHIDPAATVLLQWEGADADEDITGYEVFFGTDAASLASAGVTTAAELEVDVASGTDYFWYVRTADAQGNVTDSETFSFRVR